MKTGSEGVQGLVINDDMAPRRGAMQINAFGIWKVAHDHMDRRFNGITKDVRSDGPLYTWLITS